MNSELLTQFSEGSVRALARVLTQVENRTPSGSAILREVFPKSGRARVIGITGSPGVGKSTLVDRLAREFVTDDGPMPGIVAVDPSSPFSKGALLGDRIRMQDSEALGRIFIRSMATRGHLGGLAATTADVVTVLDAWGIDPVIVETVGVGQDEVDVARIADVSLVILVPGQGDEIQALKAGIMEIADIFVINKCDHPGADQLEHSVRAALELGNGESRPTPPILRTVATRGTGVPELRADLDRLHRELTGQPSASSRRHRAMRQRILGLLAEAAVADALGTYGNDRLEAAVAMVVERKRDPYTVVGEILELSRARRPS